MRIDGVFSGGGVKAYAFIGALRSIRENEFQIERVAGTSAGAIVASLIAAKYTVSEIEESIIQLDLTRFLDPPKITKVIPLSKWLFLYFNMGLNKGDKLEEWISNQLAQKGIYTFNDLKKGYLKVVVSDLTLGKLVVIPDDLKRIYGIDPATFSVAKAVRMSAGFPYFFMPAKLSDMNNQKSLIVDGGLLSNFPLWIFGKNKTHLKRPVLGVKLSGSTETVPTRKIVNAIDMFQALFSTMKLAHDARYVSKTKQDNIIFIPVEGVETVNLFISNKVKQELIHMGQTSAEEFLKYWPK